MIDTHAHIFDEKFSDIDEVIAECKQIGIRKILMPNIDLASIDEMLRLATRYPDYCLPMMGLHPCSVADDYETVLAAVEKSLEAGNYVAVGEMGTDLYWDKTYWSQQQEVFRRQCELAIDHQLPIVIHSRDSIDETISLVEPFVQRGLRGVFHCFTGDIEQGKQIMDMGFYLGIGGVVTFKNGGLDKVLPDLGVSKLLLETDSPYLAPTPYRGKRNSPTFLPLIAGKIGEILEISTADVSRLTDSNAQALFQLDEL
jgi:TatD DNase family protein